MSGRVGWHELKDTEQGPQRRRRHQRPDPSLHAQSFGNCCSLSFLQLRSDATFSLFHSPHLPPYVPFFLCSDFSKEAADFRPSETTAFPCSLSLEISCLSPVLFTFILLKRSCKDTYSAQTSVVHCCTSSSSEDSWASHLPLGKAISEHFYAGQM